MVGGEDPDMRRLGKEDAGSSHMAFRVEASIQGKVPNRSCQTPDKSVISQHRAMS